MLAYFRLNVTLSGFDQVSGSSSDLKLNTQLKEVLDLVAVYLWTRGLVEVIRLVSWTTWQLLQDNFYNDKNLQTWFVLFTCCCVTWSWRLWGNADQHWRTEKKTSVIMVSTGKQNTVIYSRLFLYFKYLCVFHKDIIPPPATSEPSNTWPRWYTGWRKYGNGVSLYEVMRL